jgi:hypothetical protein
MAQILMVRDIDTRGDVTIATIGEGQLVALAGMVPETSMWVEVVATGRTVHDLLWGALPLYEIIRPLRVCPSRAPEPVPAAA